MEKPKLSDPPNQSEAIVLKWRFDTFDTRNYGDIFRPTFETAL